MPIDLRTQKLAKLVVNYSVFVQPNEKVIIHAGTEAEDFVIALYKEVLLKGAFPHIVMDPKNIAPFFYKHAKPHQIQKYPEIFEHMIKNSHKYISVYSNNNTKELTNSDSKKITARQKITQPISELICNNKPHMHRCTVIYPVSAFAQEAEMSETEYENFVYNACLQDWQKLGKHMDKIKVKFKQGSKIHLIGENVDLKFKVHGSKTAADKGEENMPGGEIFMAPIKKTVEGHIKFEYPAIRAGKEVADIKLKFKKGRIIEAKASKNQDFLQQTIETDKGSHYLGELGIGCNPKITKFTKNSLFDEKIMGTIHLAIGSSYKEQTAPSQRNESAIHWDITKDMHKAKILVDDKVIQENGKWKI